MAKHHIENNYISSFSISGNNLSLFFLLNIFPQNKNMFDLDVTGILISINVLLAREFHFIVKKEKRFYVFTILKSKIVFD